MRALVSYAFAAAAAVGWAGIALLDGPLWAAWAVSFLATLLAVLLSRSPERP